VYINGVLVVVTSPSFKSNHSMFQQCNLSGSDLQVSVLSNFFLYHWWYGLIYFHGKFVSGGRSLLPIQWSTLPLGGPLRYVPYLHTLDNMQNCDWEGLKARTYQSRTPYCAHSVSSLSYS